jgi:hypothetical protein
MRTVAETARTITINVLVVLVGCVLAASLALLAELPATARAEGCSNEVIRVEQRSTALPDCRAYELVTPAEKDSGEVSAVKVGLYEGELRSGPGMHAAEGGGKMAWTSEYPLPGSAAPGLDYLSTRGPGGWTSENVVPPQSVENGLNCLGVVGMAAYSADLSVGVLADGFGQPGSGLASEGLNCGHDEPRLVLGEPETFQNLFLRDNATAGYQLVNLTPATAPAPTPEAYDQYYPANFLAGSKDLSSVVFEDDVPLTPEAGDGDELYVRTADGVHLVSLLPGGIPVHGVLGGSTRSTTEEAVTQELVPYNLANYRNAVSADGSRIFFQAEGNLYVRENAEQPHTEECADATKACTVQVDALQGGSGSGGGGEFMAASEDGSKVFFTDENRLTPDSTAEPGKPDLYEYDLNRPLTERLQDLTASTSEPADVLGISGASGDGSYVYFVAEGALTGTQHNSQGAVAQAGQPNLYLSHAGARTFIATLDPNSDSCDWSAPECLAAPLLGQSSARVSANGEFIGFNSDLSLTGYGNMGNACVPVLVGGSVEVGNFGPGACQEVFVYEAADGRLSCASCDPSGVPPVGPAAIPFPSPASQDGGMRNAYPQRNVSDAGQVFFETPDPLVPGDTNGKRDVYEWQDGRDALISSGTSDANSYFLDASVNGSDVFFATAQPLLRRDTDSAYDIYDARTGGGFPEPPASGAPCEGSGCRGAGTVAPVFSGSAASATFSGTGNLASPPTPVVSKKAVKKRAKRCKAGYERKHGRCVRKHKAKAKKPAKGRK